MPPNSYSREYLAEARAVLAILAKLRGAESIERLAAALAAVRDRGGRLFVLGVGGSAAHASHAVNDFRKLCGIEAYCPTDNVAELTARINDNNPVMVFSDWLEGSQLDADDAILILSVGGGTADTSASLAPAMTRAHERGAAIFGIVGRDGGHTAQVADCCVIVPTVEQSRVTPHTEGTCSVILHLLASHPSLQKEPTRW